MAIVEPDRCIAHFIAGPNRGRRCPKKGKYRVVEWQFRFPDRSYPKVCTYHDNHSRWMRDVVQRFYRGRYDDRQ